MSFETVEGITQAADPSLALNINSRPSLQTTAFAEIPECICFSGARIFSSPAVVLSDICSSNVTSFFSLSSLGAFSSVDTASYIFTSIFSESSFWAKLVCQVRKKARIIANENK